MELTVKNIKKVKSLPYEERLEKVVSIFDMNKPSDIDLDQRRHLIHYLKEEMEEVRRRINSGDKKDVDWTMKTLNSETE
jgi:hypothetical protein